MPADTVLVLVDELEAPGLAPRTRELIEALAGFVRPVVVARSRLKPWHRARWLPFERRFYRLADGDWEALRRAFAADLVARYAPAWAVALGWDDPLLVVELAALDIASVYQVGA